jgi:lipoprotein-releasing system permease protein
MGERQEHPRRVENRAAEMKSGKNRYEWMIALRFLLKGRGQTVLIVLGVAIGVAVQFFLASLIGGLQASLIDRTVGSAPHIDILPADRMAKPIGNSQAKSDNRSILYEERTEIYSWQQYVNDLKKDPRILYAAPAAIGSGFVERGASVVPVMVKGLTVPDGLDIYKIRKKILSGIPDLSSDSALLGKGIADRLTLSVGDKFFLRNNRGEQIFLRVGGIFDLGAPAGNELVVISMNMVRNFFGIEGVSVIEVQVKDVFSAEKIAREFGRQYERVKLESWQEKNRELLTALNSQSSSSDTIQFFVIVSISLGIASVLGIAAVQKQRQLGILKAMGTTNRSASKIFMIQGFLLGGIGSVLGVAFGSLLAYVFIAGSGAAFGLEINVGTLVTPIVLAILASVIASTIPARRAAKLSPIEVIRNG